MRLQCFIFILQLSPWSIPGHSDCRAMQGYFVEDSADTQQVLLAGLGRVLGASGGARPRDSTARGASRLRGVGGRVRGGSPTHRLHNQLEALQIKNTYTVGGWEPCRQGTHIVSINRKPCRKKNLFVPEITFETQSLWTLLRWWEVSCKLPSAGQSLHSRRRAASCSRKPRSHSGDYVCLGSNPWWWADKPEWSEISSQPLHQVCGSETASWHKPSVSQIIQDFQLDMARPAMVLPLQYWSWKSCMVFARVNIAKRQHSKQAKKEQQNTQAIL